MPITPSNETKNSVTPVNDAKTSGDLTWNGATMTWDEADGTWDVPGIPGTNDAKNSVTPTNEAKT